MRKYDYLKQSFDNVQELIRFTDTKIGAIMVLWGWEVGVFLDQTKELRVSLSFSSPLSIILFGIGVSFFATAAVAVYYSLIKVLRPGFAKHYNTESYSLFYFGHISNNEKSVLLDHAAQTDNEAQKLEIAEQLFEVSRILDRKNRYCAKVINLAFLSLIELAVFVIIKVCFLTNIST